MITDVIVRILMAFQGIFIENIVAFDKLEGIKWFSAEFAKRLDFMDSLRQFRDRFHYPKMKDLPEGTINFDLVSENEECIYFGGMSLGLQPKTVRLTIDKYLLSWANYGVLGQHSGDSPWMICDKIVVEKIAAMVGANEFEIACMNGLSVNIHILLLTFYRPTDQRHKILIESRAFPSDFYAVESQIKLNGFDPKSSLIFIEPRQNENYIRTEDILSLLEEQGIEIALVFLSGVHYYNGQLFDIPTITQVAQSKGCIVGWDLAHAIGNVHLQLHEWNVDFACWCSYKYLNSGCGGIAGIFVHLNHCHVLPRLIGWWGHQLETRFFMDNQLKLSAGADGYRLTNPSPLLCATLNASLDIFMEATMEKLREKSIKLTGYLELLIDRYFTTKSPFYAFTGTSFCCTILTPRNPSERGCQLSLSFNCDESILHNQLQLRGVVCDKRMPGVIRVAPVPLYNSFYDVHRFVDALIKSSTAVLDGAGLSHVNTSMPIPVKAKL